MSTTQFNGWATFDPEDTFAGTSLKKRAEKRTVQQLGKGKWIVHGDPKLNDAYPDYFIEFVEAEHKYMCSCYSHGQGEYRRRKMCSHVLAVILFRKKTKQEPDETGSSKPAATRIRRATYHDTEPKEPERAGSNRTARGERAMRRDDGKGSDRFKSVAADTYPDDPLPMNDDALGSPPLPDKFVEYRDNQWEAIVEIMEHLEDGCKVVMLSAPTGSGKTIIAETVRRLMAGSTVYCCTTKSLQDQIQREFEYARIIKGRSNYPTQNRKDLNLTAEDCTGTSKNEYQCSWCDSRSTCPYQMAKEDAVYSPLPILNIAYFLAETTYRDASQFRGRELVIIDEADTLEEQLMSSIEVIIGSRLRQSIGVKSLPKKTVTNDWVRWLEDEIVPAIKRHRNRLRQQSATLFGEDIEQKRQVDRLDAVLDRIAPLIKPDDDGIRRIDEGWVMTGYEGDVKDPTIKFKPVRVNLHAREVLWERGKQFLLMSATLISPAQMAEDLGLEDSEWAVVNMDSTFPIERRPVFVPSVAPMTNETKAKSWPLMAEAIEKLLNENPGVRILVHTVSYRLTQYLRDNIKSTRTLMYQGAWDRERKLEDFLNRDDAVLLAPSFGRGIDLPGEDCQVIVIAKVPYPYLGDKQISARLYSKGGQIWYSVQTIRAITQMTGRGMRSIDDWCDVYILDTAFKRLYREHKKLFPKWWRESLVLSMTDPKNRKLIDAAKERRESR